jgi:AcrR family transcriptional regulator
VGRRQARGEETRRRILDAALAEFARRGYANVTVEEIADAAGVTKGAVYYWFADKDDLGRDLQHALYERLALHAARALDPAADAVTNLRRGFDAYLEALGDFDEARFFLRDAWTIPVLDEAGQRDHEYEVSVMRGRLAAAIGRGEVAPVDPEVLARALLAVVAETTLHVLRTGDRRAAEEVVDRLLESLRAVPAAGDLVAGRKDMR